MYLSAKAFWLIRENSDQAIDYENMKRVSLG